MRQIRITEICPACEALKPQQEKLHVGDICTLIKITPESVLRTDIIKPNGHTTRLCFLYKYEEYIVPGTTLTDYIKQNIKE